jgi:hypothetical protein
LNRVIVRGEPIVKRRTGCRSLGYVVLVVVSLAPAGLAGEFLSVPTDTRDSVVTTETKTDGNTAAGTTPSSLPADLSTAVTGTGTEKKPALIEPAFIRPLTKIEPGRNDSNPLWSPLGTLIAFERSVGERKRSI